MSFNAVPDEFARFLRASGSLEYLEKRCETVSNEKEIREKLIDEKLRKAGWNPENNTLVKGYVSPEEHSLTAKESSAHRVSSPAQKRSTTYALRDKGQQPIALLEASYEDTSPLDHQEQAAQVAKDIFTRTRKQPFIFLSNGEKTYFWDREYSSPREVNGVYRLEDMERLRDLRLYAQPLHLIQPDLAIVEREYQLNAIKTVVDGIKLRKRKFLLVMATGTGKTRTVIALIDLLIRAKRIRRVLFLADRRELVRQASQAFKEFLPGEPQQRVENGTKNDEATIHLATYPGMMQALDQISPGYYDLIVADESHRSIYKRYKTIFTHFDALQIGLTATPTDFIEHNTYELFDCSDHAPTFEYPFETAIAEDNLVNFKVLEAKTRFQIEGIHGRELPDEIRQLMKEQGIDEGEIDFENTDFERKVTNTGTNDEIVREFMQQARKDALGLPAKSILFAVSHRHALELQASFKRLYPGLQERGLAQVIDSRVQQAEKFLEDFKTRDMPRVAISVDMLDTGVDVPAIQNLVFAKPVYSQVKFWQMVGRGTRLWRDPVTGARKNDFLIIDHWNNFTYFKLNPEGEVPYPDEPLLSRLFRLRIERLLTLKKQSGNEALIQETQKTLEEMLEALSHVENIQVNAQRVYLSQQALDDLYALQQEGAE